MFLIDLVERRSLEIFLKVYVDVYVYKFHIYSTIIMSDHNYKFISCIYGWCDALGSITDLVNLDVGSNYICWIYSSRMWKIL